MDRRDFFKKTSVVTLGLIFAPAVAKVLAEEAPEIRCGEGLWAYVRKNGITKYYTLGQLCVGDLEILQNPPGWALDYQFIHRTGTVGIEAIKKAVDQSQMAWFRIQKALENEK